MTQLVDAILVLLVLSGFLLLASSRIATCIRAVAMQGVLLGFVVIAVQDGQLSIATTLLAAISAAVKGLVLPLLLVRAMREADAAQEVEPLIGYNWSLLAGAASLGLGQQVRLPNHPASPFLVPAAIFTMAAGLILLVTRRKAITQVIGYLSLENGVYLFGTVVATQMPVLLELGILLDVLVGVFVMGIAMFHISRQFDHIETDRLTSLTDQAQ